MRGIVMMVLMSMNQLFAQNISMNWAKSINGTNQEVGKSVVTDKNGNSYTCGYFTGTADFNPGTSSLNQSSNGYQDIFITKLDSSGNFIWSKTFGGIGNDMVYSIAIDAQNNIYTTGFFHQTVDFDPGMGVESLSSYETNSQDIFVLKLDSNGMFKWVKSFSGSGYSDSLNNYYPAVSTGYSIGIDSSSHVYIAGSFLGSIDFDPGNSMQIESSTSVSNIFICKLDSNGNFNWVRHIGENRKGDEAYALCLDNSGNCIVTGVFADTMDIDPGSGIYQLVSPSYTSVFVLKLNTNGDFVWGERIGGNQPNDQSSGYALTSDAIGQLYIAGNFKGQINLNSNSIPSDFTSNGNYDMFVLKINQNGDNLWMNTIGGPYADYCNAVKVDASLNILLTGAFRGNIDADPTVNQFMLNSTTNYANDIFLIKLNNNGNFQWAESFGGVGNDQSIGLNLSKNRILLTGYYSNTLLLPSGINLNSLGGVDGFILNLNQIGMILPISLLQFEGLEVAAGNLLKWTCDSDDPSYYIHLERSEDGEHFSSLKLFECLQNSSKQSEYLFLDTEMNHQILYYRLKLIDTDNKSSYSNIIKLKHAELQDKFLIYPNPCKTECSILCPVELKDASLHLINMKGEMVYMQQIQNKKTFKIDLSNQTNGMYQLNIHEKFGSNYKLLKSTSIQIIN